MMYFIYVNQKYIFIIIKSYLRQCCINKGHYFYGSFQPNIFYTYFIIMYNLNSCRFFSLCNTDWLFKKDQALYFENEMESIKPQNVSLNSF